MALTSSRPVVKDVSSSAMRIRCEMHLHRLNQELSGRVKSVDIAYDVQRDGFKLSVLFKNGYHLNWDEDDIHSDVFKASAIMLYDLPHRD